ncbi:MAG: 50S ribosomal protein L21 [Nitrospirae bacterium]|nr:50S ribosomal protein L21 [Nitrospirota bacterium]
MYAIIETGGKQYRVSSGDSLNIEKLSADPGATITLDKVLAIIKDGNTIAGTPYVKGAEVSADVVGSFKGEKVIIHKQRPRKVYRKTNGHRQQFTTLKIKDIVYGG